jgi:hypothetical protein
MLMKIVLLFSTIDQILFLGLRSTLQCSFLHFINYIYIGSELGLIEQWVYFI